jgi:hypothetical protein
MVCIIYILRVISGVHSPCKEHKTQTKSRHTTYQTGATTDDPEEVDNTNHIENCSPSE